MRGFPYDLDEPPRGVLGLISLHVDETVEADLRRYLPATGARLHVTRLRSGDTLTPGSIAGMKVGLTAAAQLLPPAAHFDVIAYACTSGTALLGAEEVHGQVAAGATTAAVTDPLTAGLAAMHALGLKRIGVVSPYVADVSEPLCAAFDAGGVAVTRTLSFGEEEEARVARIAPASIAAATREVARGGGIDGLFLSCTNLRTADLLGPLTAELGLPVLASNQVLAWHMLKLAGLPAPAALPLPVGHRQG